MRASRFPYALSLAGVVTFAASTLPAAHPPIPLCSQLEGQPATLRGRVVLTIDNISPDTDFGETIVLDPMVRIALLRLRRPVCIADEAVIRNRVAVQDEVTVVELLLSEGINLEDIGSQARKIRTVEGILSVNVWWRYKATMLMTVTHIE
jgi:hypothetical protein